MRGRWGVGCLDGGVKLGSELGDSLFVFVSFSFFDAFLLRHDVYGWMDGWRWGSGWDTMGWTVHGFKL